MYEIYSLINIFKKCKKQAVATKSFKCYIFLGFILIDIPTNEYNNFTIYGLWTDFENIFTCVAICFAPLVLLFLFDVV